MKVEKKENLESSKTKSTISYEIRTIDSINAITKRLNIINGQIKGIGQMVENDRSCNDILIQIASVTKALNSLGTELLRSYLETHVLNDIKNNNLDSLNEFLDLYKLMN